MAKRVGEVRLERQGLHKQGFCLRRRSEPLQSDAQVGVRLRRLRILRNRPPQETSPLLGLALFQMHQSKIAEGAGMVGIEGQRTTVQGLRLRELSLAVERHRLIESVLRGGRSGARRLDAADGHDQILLSNFPFSAARWWRIDSSRRLAVRRGHSASGSRNRQLGRVRPGPAVRRPIGLRAVDRAAM